MALWLRSAGAIVVLAAIQIAAAEEVPKSPPTTYELVINGETFVVEANRDLKLASKSKPGVTYDVAIRIAPVQRFRMKDLRFDYDFGSRLEDNRQTERRSVKVSHELGFSTLITDLGGAMEASSRDTALKMLTESVLGVYRKNGLKDADTEVARLADAQFRGAEGRGVRIRHRDAEGIWHVTLIYLLVGKTFTGSCITQFLESDSETVLPLVKRTLDSIEGTAEAKAPAPRPAKP